MRPKAGTGKLERFSIDIDREDDGSLAKNITNMVRTHLYRAIDNRHSGLRGTIRLMKYMEDGEAENIVRNILN